MKSELLEEWTEGRREWDRPGRERERESIQRKKGKREVVLEGEK